VGLKIGVWARLHMEKRTDLGEKMLSGFFDYDRRRHARRRNVETQSMLARATRKGSADC